MPLNADDALHAVQLAERPHKVRKAHAQSVRAGGDRDRRQCIYGDALVDGQDVGVCRRKGGEQIGQYARAILQNAVNGQKPSALAAAVGEYGIAVSLKRAAGNARQARRLRGGGHLAADKQPLGFQHPLVYLRQRPRIDEQQMIR